MRILKCIKKGSDLKVEVVGESGYVQFPKHLRVEGKMFAVDSLKKVSTHWRVEGEIYELTPISGSAPVSKESTTEYIEFTEDNDNEGETWSFFAPKDMPGVCELIKIYDLYTKEDEWKSNQYSYKTVSKKIVDTLMKRKSKTSYMNEYNLVTSIIPPKEVDKSLKSFASVDSLDKIDTYLYKGKCFSRK